MIQKKDVEYCLEWDSRETQELERQDCQATYKKEQLTAAMRISFDHMRIKIPSSINSVGQAGIAMVSDFQVEHEAYAVLS